MTFRGGLLWGLLVAIGACGGSNSNGGNAPPPFQFQPAPPPVAEAAPFGEVNGTPTEQMIGAAGGTITTEDGAFSIAIPAGALAADTLIKIEPITNTAFGGLRGSYRVSPEGQTFAQPVTMTMQYTDADLAGTAAGALSIAYQSPDGFWHRYKAPALDEGAKKLTVSTTHFSNWSMVAGARISPTAATVGINQSITLAVEDCRVVEGETPDVAVMAQCRRTAADEDIGAAINWTVNGIPNGNSSVGTINGLQDGGLYTAPGQAPPNNPVAVGCSFVALPPNRVLLTSNITVSAGLTWSGNISSDTTEDQPGGGRVRYLFGANVTFTPDPKTPAEGFFIVSAGTWNTSYTMTKTDCSTRASGTGSLASTQGGISTGSLQIFNQGGWQYVAQVTGTGTLSGTSTCNDKKEPMPADGLPAGSAGSFQPRSMVDDKTIIDEFNIPSTFGTSTIRINLTRQ